MSTAICNTPRASIPALLLGAVALLMTSPGRAAEPTTEKQARALLEKHCYRCHSHQSGKKRGRLVLDSRAALLKGGATGPAIVPGHPDKGLLLRAVHYGDEDLQMPPDGKLAATEIAALEAWVRAGAPWSAGPATTARMPGKITAADRRYWAFQSPRATAPPMVDDPEWNVHPIDRFIRARLEKDGLRPAPLAAPRVLVRRITFDLTGLPPTPEQIEEFCASAQRDPQRAVETLVDRLLASPHYGERWARHWLDVVRYAESDGFRQDAYRPAAWSYRDYVIRAFNEDRPYDRFVREQLAGDELAPGDPEARTATGFLCHGIYEYNQRNVRGQWDDMLNEVADVTGEVFLGLSVGCARCHDHKYDPILQRDYFALRAFFAALLPPVEVHEATQEQQSKHERGMAHWREQTATIRAEIAKLVAPECAKAEEQMVVKFPRDVQAMLRKPAAARSPLEQQLAALAYRQVQYEFDHIDGKMKGEAKTRLLKLRKELARFDALKPAPLACCQTVRETGSIAPPTMIPRKADADVAPALLTVLGGDRPAIVPPAGGATTGRRTALARWLTRPDHPLTARVMVNRVWQRHFGRGLVGTTNDFGKLGDAPSHPALLDWLACRFVADGWSLKHLHRLIVTSRTYQQAAVGPVTEAARKADPENRLLARRSSRRLDAEQVRDALLAVTGRLDLTVGGPGVDFKKPRRSVYLKALRNTRDPLLEVFDLPEGFVSAGKRNVTTTAPQALLLMNAPQLQEHARAFAERVTKDTGSRDEAGVDRAFRLAFGRTPTADETRAAIEFLHAQARRVGGEEAARRRTAWVDFCQVLLNANEFVYVD